MRTWFAWLCVFMPNDARADTWDFAMTVMVLTMLICVVAVLETTVNS